MTISAISFKTRSPPIGGAGKTPRHKKFTKSRFRQFLELQYMQPEVADDVITSNLVMPC